jgi:phosphate-selective porin OprO/OprP
MKRGLFGPQIGVIMLVAVCAGPVLAGRRPPPLKVNVKPRMASSANPTTARAAGDDEAKYAEGDSGIDGRDDRVWHDPVVGSDPPVVDVPTARKPAVPHGFETDPIARPDPPTLAPPPPEIAAPREPRVDDQTPASYATWESPDNDTGLSISNPIADTPTVAPAADFPLLEPIVEVPVTDRPFETFETNNLPPNMVGDTDIGQLRDRINDLEQDRQLRQLAERVREVEDAVDVTDEPWKHKWGGRIQSDIVYWPDDAALGGQLNYVEFRRLRIFCSGEGYGVWDYKLEFDLAPEVQGDAIVVNNRVDLDNFGLELKDAYLGIMDIPVLGYVRAGHFKVPFGLEELTSSKYITFMERNLPHRFAPGREFGIAASRHIPEANVTWAYGAFYDDLSETAHAIENDNQGFRAGFRGTWAPWYDECTGGRNLLHTGMAYLYTRDADREVRFTARPEIHRGDPLIDTGILAATELQQVGTEIAWVNGPLSLQSEFVGTHLHDATLGDVNLWGTYASASYFLTGEHRPYDREEGVFRRVSPYENFWFVNTVRGCASGSGAWELAVRWSYLDFKDVNGQELHDVTAGVNWYWNPYARLMFNWIHPFRRDNTTGAAQGDVIGMRFQVDF